MSEEKDSLEKEVKELKETVSQLLELERMRLQREGKTETTPKPKTNTEDREAILEDLKEFPLGEVVVYALKHNLIKRSDN